jgi:hypothetical protein
MTILKIQNPPVNYTQTIYASLWIAGAQKVEVDTHGVRGPGSHIAVAAEQVLIYLHDFTAAQTYANAWIDGIMLAGQLPDTVPVTEQHTGPALMVRANGADDVRHGWDPVLQTLLIRIGNFTWRVRDRNAYDTMRAAWMQVHEIAPIILRRR